MLYSFCLSYFCAWYFRPYFLPNTNQKHEKIIVEAPNAQDVDEQHRNKIVIAQVFTVDKGTTDKHDESRQHILKEFPYQIVSEERRAYLETEIKKIYHHMPLQYYDPTLTDYECMLNFHELDIGT